MALLDGTTTAEAAVPVQCFCAGTTVLTERGNMAVERLRKGDLVVTLGGRFRPVHWIGQRSFESPFLDNRPGLLPVLIRAGALAEGMPRRDLLVSPSHGLYLEGLLIPAGALLNGTTISQLGDVDRVDYFHIELSSHDIILAEGAPVESFLDQGGRAMFHNAAEYSGSWREGRCYPCAPRAVDGPVVEQIRRRLAGPALASPLAASA